LKTSLYNSVFALHIPAPMSFLGFNMLNVSITALAVIFVFVCLLMVLLVLMQRPKQEGLGAAFGASTTDQLFGARTTNVLQKGTVYLAVSFFVLTFTLAVLMQKKSHSKFNSLTTAEAPAAVEAPPATDLPVKSLSDEIPVTVTPGQPAPTEVPAAETPPVEAPAETPPVIETPPVTETPSPETPPTAPAEADKTPQQ
jgi:preprotein translocase subunit SecG